ncbi:hypothetical protein OBBRIDRAFT_852484, partial [Obba rivulosa]
NVYSGHRRIQSTLPQKYVYVLAVVQLRYAPRKYSAMSGIALEREIRRVALREDPFVVFTTEYSRPQITHAGMLNPVGNVTFSAVDILTRHESVSVATYTCANTTQAVEILDDIVLGSGSRHNSHQVIAADWCQHAGDHLRNTIPVSNASGGTAHAKSSAEKALKALLEYTSTMSESDS